MGNRGSAPADMQQAAVESMEQALQATRRRRVPLPHDGSLDFVEVPRLFTTIKSFSTEWNLCGKFDPTRRVNVVSDAKLHRKHLKYHFVDKIARLRMNSEAVALARNELEIAAFLSNFCNLHLGYIHRNIVHLYGYFTFRRKAHVIVEFCELGSLMTAYLRAPDPGLRLNSAPSEDELCDAMHQILSGLDFLHTNGVAHCDLALDNIYVLIENVFKIGDFDRAVFVGPENLLQQLKVNEPPRKTYGAPEIYESENKKIDLMKADMWSVGIVFIMLLTKKPLFDSACADDKGFQLYSRVGLRAYLKAMYLEQSALCKLSDEMVNLAEGLLTPNPAMRLSVKEALNSSWFCASRAASKRFSSMDLARAAQQQDGSLTSAATSHPEGAASSLTGS